MTRLVIAVLIFCFSLAAEQVIQIPTIDKAHTLSVQDRKALELLLMGLTVEQGIQEGHLVPGTVVDFNNPGVAFVRDFNLWLEKRKEIEESFGHDAFAQVNDVSELIRFDSMMDSWKEYCEKVDEAYKVHKKSRKKMKKLQRAFELEKRGW